jgi:dihydrofolate reductase
MTDGIDISAIAAMAENRVIGKDNSLLWHIPEDLKLFKKRTMGKPIIMGRKTFESVLGYLGKPMPGRTSLVLSNSSFNYEGVDTFSDIREAIEKAKQIAKDTGQDEIFIGGGSQIYELAMPYTNKIYLTTVNKRYEGDSYFPTIEENEWSEISNESYLENDPSFSIKILERKDINQAN